MGDNNIQLEDARSVIKPELAHQLSELLTIIYGNLELLRQQSLDDRGRAQLSRADEAIHQLWEIIRGVSGPVVP